MAEEQCNLQRISWSETFPFVRLFATFKRAVSFWPMVLAFVAVLACYVSGRILDRFWLAADAGVLVADGLPELRSGSGRSVARVLGARGPGIQDEVQAYATQDATEFVAWKRDARERWERAREQADERTESSDTPAPGEDFLERVALQLETGLTRIDENAELDAAAKERQRDQLNQAADLLRLAYAGKGAGLTASTGETRAASATLLAAADLEPEQRREVMSEWSSELASRTEVVVAERLEPRGPFISLFKYEMNCFAAAVQGVCNGRWGHSGSALSDEPAMVGSIASAGSGVLWLATQRPCYAVFLTLIYLVIFALFGGAICRISAVRSARDESLSGQAAFKFSLDKLGALVAAPLLPIGVFLFAAVLIFLGGLVAAIPGLEVIAGPIYVLALLGGVVLAFVLVGVVTGFHLMWPTIAVEGSDAFDAVQRALGYVFQRAWHVGFYSFALLLYGAVSFVIVRLLGMLLLKLTHVATGLGMNLATSAKTSTIGKLDAIWHMPDWQDLPLLPAVGDVNFWGSFGNAPLSGAESFAWFFFMLWIWGLVALVGAFVVSFYFCGSTQMYFLLRRDVDAVDYDEIYYEEPEDEFSHESETVADSAAAAEPMAPLASETATEPEPPADPAPSGEVDQPEPSDEAEKPKKPRKPRKPRKPKLVDDAETDGAPDDSSSD